MDFMKPALGSCIRGFEPGVHEAIDIAAPGNVSVKASADGVISRSYYCQTYGETIFIVHHIGGEIYESIYTHMRPRSRKFSVGESIKQGTIIGYMGSTGHAEVQHLHFEIHKGRWNQEKKNAVNPLDYMDKSLPKPFERIFIMLPPDENEWPIYSIEQEAASGNEIGMLHPAEYGGLIYEVIANPEPDVYSIKTDEAGVVNVRGMDAMGVRVFKM